MTQMGIDYLKYEELKRSNLAKEQETRRYNEESLAEAKRANAERERQNQLSLDEAARHNAQQEANDRYKADLAAQTSMYNTDKNVALGFSSLSSSETIAALNRSQQSRMQAATLRDNVLARRQEKQLKRRDQDLAATKQAQDNARKMESNDIARYRAETDRSVANMNAFSSLARLGGGLFKYVTKFAK